MKFRHTVVGCKWDHHDGLWYVSVRGPDGNEFIDSCHVLVNGTGVLKQVPCPLSRLNKADSYSNWKWPDIEGLSSFKGILQHSANYQEGLDLTNKRVAVIGTGSSGVQIIAKIAPQVKQLYTWIRSPTWITAGFAQRFAGPQGANFACESIERLGSLGTPCTDDVSPDTEEQKKTFRDKPELFLRYSKMIESELNQRFKFILKNTREADLAKEVPDLFTIHIHSTSGNWLTG